MQDGGVAQTAFQHTGIDGLDLARCQGLDGYAADGGIDVPLDIALVTAGRPRGAVGGNVSDQPLVDEIGNGLLGLINVGAVFYGGEAVSE